MSVKDRRRISAMTPEAEKTKARREAEGMDPVTGRRLCEGVDCGCAAKHGAAVHNPADGKQGGGA
ncbi:MAG: hypothetical protein LBH70_05835 [Spirochaetaceae bacterium]|jgi:hypothetical protein|nr:hypothetical protein [Spirochaetaceae bacterium]